MGVSGHVNKPGVYEMPTGVLLTDIIHKHAGGVPGNKRIKAVIPGGSSTMILRGESIEGVSMDFESLKAAGSSVGTAGLIVMDEDTDLIRVITRITAFYHHESCGQCTPCREGTGWMHKILTRFMNHEATMKDLDLLLDVANNIEGNTICALGDAAAWPVQSMIKRFRRGRSCPRALLTSPCARTRPLRARFRPNPPPLPTSRANSARRSSGRSAPPV